MTICVGVLEEFKISSVSAAALGRFLSVGRNRPRQETGLKAPPRVISVFACVCTHVHVSASRLQTSHYSPSEDWRRRHLIPKSYRQVCCLPAVTLLAMTTP